MSDSDKMREVKQKKKNNLSSRVGVQTLTASRNKLPSICITVHVCFWVNMLQHILGFQRNAFTLTGRDQLGTINERLYIIFPGRRHYKLRQLADGKESWHGCEEKRRHLGKES